MIGVPLETSAPPAFIEGVDLLLGKSWLARQEAVWKMGSVVPTSERNWLFFWLHSFLRWSWQYPGSRVMSAHR